MRLLLAMPVGHQLDWPAARGFVAGLSDEVLERLAPECSAILGQRLVLPAVIVRQRLNDALAELRAAMDGALLPNAQDYRGPPKGKLLLPSEVTPHMLRRTFASMCFFAGRDLKWTMGQLGHEDARMSAAVYAQWRAAQPHRLRVGVDAHAVRRRAGALGRSACAAGGVWPRD